MLTLALENVSFRPASISKNILFRASKIEDLALLILGIVGLCTWDKINLSNRVKWMCASTYVIYGAFRLAVPFLFAKVLSKPPWPDDLAKEWTDKKYEPISWTAAHPTADALKQKPEFRQLTLKEKQKAEEIDASAMLLTWLIEIQTGDNTIIETIADDEGDTNITIFQRWLEEDIHLPEKYVAMTNQVTARNIFVEKLQTLAVCMEECTLERKQMVMVSLMEASKVCAPTWIKQIDEEIWNLRSENNLRTLILRCLVGIKKDLFQKHHDELKRLGGYEWHKETISIYLAGKELGLELADYNDVDGTLGMYIQDARDDHVLETKYQIFSLAAEHFTKEQFIKALPVKMQFVLEKDYPKILMDYFIKKDFPNCDPEDPDEELNVVIPKYFLGETGHVHLSEEGAKALLEHVGYM